MNIMGNKTKNGFYRKYLLSRTDGKPLKGQEYFILRLDSKDPVEREADEIVAELLEKVNKADNK